LNKTEFYKVLVVLSWHHNNTQAPSIIKPVNYIV